MTVLGMSGMLFPLTGFPPTDVASWKKL